MTDRLKGLWVVFEEDVRTDDAEVTIAAIKQLRGVLDVRCEVATPADWMNRERMKAQLRAKLREALE